MTAIHFGDREPAVESGPPTSLAQSSPRRQPKAFKPDECVERIDVISPVARHSSGLIPIGRLIRES